MKKELIIIVLILLTSTLTFAAERAEVREQWVARQNGVIVEDREKTTSMMIPNSGATEPQVRRIVREENKKLLTVKDARHITAVNNLAGKIDGENASIKTEAKNIGDQNYNNTWLLSGIIVAGFIIVIVMMLILRRRNNAAITAGVDAVVKEIEQVPTKTATKVNELDPSPFTFEVAGHAVEYVSPIKGIKEGYYLLLNVPMGVDYIDPAKFERIPQHKRGLAISSIKSTMRQYLEGKFAGDDLRSKLQNALIEYLQKTGDLKIRKIS